jgi:hypothetical protein
MKQLLLFTFLVLFLPGIFPLAAQTLTKAATRYSDAFDDWILYTLNDDIEGTLQRRWKTTDDWTTWDYRIGEQTGQIKLKWDNNPNEWEIRGDNQIITARTVYHNDFRQWRLSDGSTRITIGSRYGDIYEDWEIKEDNAGYFGIFTVWEGDPREWKIIDELSDQVTMPMKMAMAFLVLSHSTPKG